MAIYILVWPAFFTLAFINGALRELTYGRYLSEYKKHAAGTVTGTVMIGIAIYVVNIIWPFHGRLQAFYVGLVWTVMTVIAETVMILFFMKKDLNFLLSAYDITKGQLWLLFLVFLIVFPLLIEGSGI
ncbi:MAG: hypothetical protein ACHQ6U_03885 [Thermodesulfobacteriota bacterium]